MESRTFRLRPIWFIVIGMLLVLWGGFAIYNLFRDGSIMAAVEDAQSSQGFLPYLIQANSVQMAPTLEVSAPVATETITPTLNPTQVEEVKLTPTAVVTATPEGPYIPDRVVIPSINLDAPIVYAKEKIIRAGGTDFEQWLAPDEFAAGWHFTSAHPGEKNNMVLNGHHNEFGEVFKRLVDLKPGDLIEVYSNGLKFRYQVANKLILPERDVNITVRLENARWISPSQDERLTLITCWPYSSNTHRLIIVASPIPGG